MSETAPNGKPKVKCEIVGKDGNAFAVMSRATNAMRHAGWTSAEIEEYRKKAMAGDYNNLLAVTMEYVDDIGEDSDDDWDNDDDWDEEDDEDE